MYFYQKQIALDSFFTARCRICVAKARSLWSESAGISEIINRARDRNLRILKPTYTQTSEEATEMSVIFAIERKRFKEKQETLHRRYETLGMTKEQI